MFPMSRQEQKDKPQWKTIMVIFSAYEYEKLRKLAARRNISIKEVLRYFAQSCNPDGDHWKSPINGK
jgi:hypothetical protein